VARDGPRPASFVHAAGGLEPGLGQSRAGPLLGGRIAGVFAKLAGLEGGDALAGVIGMHWMTVIVKAEYRHRLAPLEATAPARLVQPGQPQRGHRRDTGHAAAPGRLWGG
jgi:hypothetical protein